MDRSRDKDRNKKGRDNRNKDNRNGKNKAFGLKGKNDKYNQKKKKGLFSSSSSASRRRDEAMRQESKDRKSGQSFEAMGYRGKNKTGLYEHDLEKGLGAGHTRDDKGKTSNNTKKGGLLTDHDEDLDGMNDTSRHIDDIPYTRGDTPPLVDDDEESEEFNSFSDIDEEMGLSPDNEHPVIFGDNSKTRPSPPTAPVPSDAPNESVTTPNAEAPPSVSNTAARKETPVALAAAAAAVAASNNNQSSPNTLSPPVTNNAATQFPSKSQPTTPKAVPTDKHPLANHSPENATAESVSSNHVPSSPTSAISTVPLLSRQVSRKSTTTNKSESSEKPDMKLIPQTSLPLDDALDDLEEPKKRSAPFKMTQVKLILFCGLGVFTAGLLLFIFGGIVSWGVDSIHFTLITAIGVIAVGIATMIASLVVKVKRRNHPEKTIDELCTTPQCTRSTERDDESVKQAKAPLVQAEMHDDS